MEYIAFTTKGLESVSRNEIEHLFSSAEINEVGTKRILFTFDGDPKELTQLKTVDDIGILLGKITSADLDEIISYAKTLDFVSALSEIKKTREVDNEFSITTTLARVNAYNSSEVTDQLSKVIAQKTGLKFLEDKRSSFDVRIFADGENVYFSVRLTKEALYNRSYKTLSKSGSLKASIAASMVQLCCDRESGLKIVDSFCGSGTILAEALLAGNQVFGADKDAESVKNSINNLNNLRYETSNKLKVLEAGRTSWPDGFFDCAISNLPWGKQVKIDSITDLYKSCLKEYQRILKDDGKLCLLVSNPELLIKHAKRFFPKHKIQTIKIGYLGQNPTIVLIK